MLHALRPAQIANVDQSIDSVFDLNEGAKIGQIANLSFHRASDWVLVVQLLPRILLELLQSERDATLCWIYVQHDRLNFIAGLHDLGRMLHPLRPCHLAYMNETFNALLQLDESSVVRNAENPPANVRTD